MIKSESFSISPDLPWETDLEIPPYVEWPLMPTPERPDFCDNPWELDEEDE